MADSEMSEHVPTSTMELFCARGLLESELATIVRHLTKCSDCHQQLVATLRRQKGGGALSFTLAPEFWLRHEHIEYEQLVELADNKLDPADHELIDLHLNVCPPCQEDVRSFLAFREQIAPELDLSYAPVMPEPAREKSSSWNWWRGLAWKPVYSAALVVIGIALVIGVALFLNRRSDNFQAEQTPLPQASPASTGQTPAPDNLTVQSPTVTSSTESPSEKPITAEAIVVLNDRSGTITVNKSGDVTGLDDLPSPMRDQIAKALLTERIERPAILRDLAGEESALRGSDKQSFKLIAPTRTVIVSNRPTFRWEKVPGATNYRVYINDPSGREVVRSEELPSESSQWAVPKALKRGEIYAWSVVADADGKEIVSPGPSPPEMKFRVLSASSLQQLNTLKKTRSHLALGVFYAREGMIAEVEREFHILLKENPHSVIAKKLLKQVQSWQNY